MPLSRAARDTITGSIVLLLLLASVVPSVWRTIRPGAPRAKEFRFWTPEGREVKESSPVRMNGLEVGAVDAIDISSRGNIEVRFRVEAAYAPLVREDARAALVAPLTGLTYVVLEPGTPSERESAGGRIKVFTPKTLEQKLEWSQKKSEEFAAKIEPLIQKADISAHNSDLIAKHIEDGDGVLGAIQRKGGPLADLDRVTASIAKITEDLRDVNDAIARREGALGRLANPDDPMYASARAVAARADETIANFDRAAKRLESSSGALQRRLDRAIEDVKDVPGILDDIKAVGAEMVAAADKATRKVGTIGRFVTDRDFVGDLRRWVAEIQQSSDSSDNPLVNYVTGLTWKSVPFTPDKQFGPQNPEEKAKGE